MNGLELLRVMFSAGVFLALIFVIVAVVRWVGRGHRRLTKYRLEHEKDVVVLAERDSSALASNDESPVEVWQALYSLGSDDDTLGVRGFSHVFLAFDHDLEMVIHPKRFPVRGILDRLTALARPIGFTSGLRLGLPEIDEHLHIHVPRNDRSARGRLRTHEFRQLLERVTAVPDLNGLYLLPRNVRRRQFVFGSALVRAVDFRSGILVVFECDLEDLDLEKVAAIARAARLCREVLSGG